METLEIFAYPAVVYFIDQNWLSEALYFIRSVLVCKIFFYKLKRKSHTFVYVHVRYLLY